MKDSSELKLYTFAISHYSEKIRWSLDYSGIPYQEKQLTPFFHLSTTLRLGQKTSVPILEQGDECIQDSTEILFWLEQNFPQFQLIPTELSEREHALEIEQKMDRLGNHIIRYAYSILLDYRKNMVNLWGKGGKPWRKNTLAVLFPVLKLFFEKQAHLGNEEIQRSQQRIRADLDWLDSEIQTGKEFLVGDRLTIADIVTASLLAPIAHPEAHPIYSSPEYVEPLKFIFREWDDRPSIQWVRDFYKKYR
ncbi:MAG: glutathione S-transferase [bacterium]|jgi:glutathione S-transferase